MRAPLVDPHLRQAYDAVKNAGRAAGLHPPSVIAEAASVAAAVCRDAPEAAAAWGRLFDLSPDRFTDFGETGAHWETRPTRALATLIADGRTAQAQTYALAIAGLAIDACSLDPDPSPACISSAALISRVQLEAVAGSLQPTTEPQPGEPEASLAELLAELDGLIGLKAVKDRVHRQVALLRVNELRREQGLKTVPVSRHLVFVGNPGTGKTTVARLVARIYRVLELLPSGQLVETDRSGLVAGYVGQTALKTTKVIEQALGGVLFIDEAYALASDAFGNESINTIVKAMEDNRDRLVVVVAGYPAEMAEFIASNPGLESRFGTTIAFPDYTDDELVAMFEMFCRNSDFAPTPGCLDKLKARLGAEPRDKGFGNGRFVRNLFEAALEHQAWRLRSIDEPTVDDLRSLRADDLPER